MKILNDLNLNIEDDKKKLDINYMSNLIDKLSEISNNIRNKINLNLLNSLTLIQKNTTKLQSIDSHISQNLIIISNCRLKIKDSTDKINQPINIIMKYALYNRIIEIISNIKIIKSIYCIILSMEILNNNNRDELYNLLHSIIQILILNKKYNSTQFLKNDVKIYIFQYIRFIKKYSIIFNRYISLTEDSYNKTKYSINTYIESVMKLDLNENRWYKTDHKFIRLVLHFICTSYILSYLKSGQYEAIKKCILDIKEIPKLLIYEINKYINNNKYIEDKDKLNNNIFRKIIEWFLRQFKYCEMIILNYKDYESNILFEALYNTSCTINTKFPKLKRIIFDKISELELNNRDCENLYLTILYNEFRDVVLQEIKEYRNFFV
ncbi:hypothetical protein cand_018330 [Cryptosporidium andersoni]|uniref:Uncharacterized protein n=1 Tax=Cryptosporidium andersoni TaxID=117008 RepID=A0A1J4M9V3_9CRYT|nr:hypothetical protein cand_018330 [Cryptosporidium andersoni]